MKNPKKMAIIIGAILIYGIITIYSYFFHKADKSINKTIDNIHEPFHKKYIER